MTSLFAIAAISSVLAILISHARATRPTPPLDAPSAMRRIRERMRPVAPAFED